MRILSPAPTIATKHVFSSIFALSIRVRDVDNVLSERITADIENYLSQSAAEAVMARNEAHATVLGFACSIRYAKAVNQANLTQNLRARHIYPCFPEKNTGGRAVHVDVRPLERWDASTVETMSSLWSKAPWRLVFAGWGAPKGRAAGWRLEFCAQAFEFGFGWLCCFIDPSASPVSDQWCRTAAAGVGQPAWTGLTSGGKNRAAAACGAAAAAGADAAAATAASAMTVAAGPRLPRQIPLSFPSRPLSLVCTASLIRLRALFRPDCVLPPSPRRRETARRTLRVGRPTGDRACGGRSGQIVCSGRSGAASGWRCRRRGGLLQAPRRHQTASRIPGRPTGGRACCCSDDRRRGGSRRSAWRSRRPTGSESECPAAGSRCPTASSRPARHAAATASRRHGDSRTMDGGWVRVMPL